MSTERYNIRMLLLRGTFYALLAGMAVPVMAQDDIYADGVDGGDTAVARPRQVQEKYELMTVKGTILEESSKKPLAGIQVKALANARYAAMSDEKGHFEIKVPTFTTSLYVYAPEFSSQIVCFFAPSAEDVSCMLSSGVQVSLGSATDIDTKESIVTGFLEEYGPGKVTAINVRVPSEASVKPVGSDNVQAGDESLDGSDGMGESLEGSGLEGSLEGSDLEGSDGSGGSGEGMDDGSDTVGGSDEG